MTRTIFLITGIVLAALAVAVPSAFAAERVGGSVGPVEVFTYLDAPERADLNATPQWQQALEIRSQALNRQFGLGEQALKARAQAEKALEIRGEALNRQYGLGVYGITDSHERGQPVSTEPVSTPTVGSGSDVEWPQVGIGFGVGILLAAGLLFAMRSTRIRPLAH